MACADVATAKAKTATAINLIISFLPCQAVPEEASRRTKIKVHALFLSYWQRYIMPSPPLIAVPGRQPMPLRAA
jgi:hypothetical protein